jgi:SNF2 family DNA or RNA helicase
LQELQNVSPSAQLTSEQLNEIIEDEKNTNKDAWEVQEQVEDGKEVLDPANTSSVLNTVLSTINNEFELECLDEAVRLLNAHSIGQSTDDRVPGHKYSIPGLPGTKFLVHQVWAIWFIVRRWVWDAVMPGALVADEMGLGKTFTSVAAAMLCKLLTEKVVMGPPLSILWGNTLEEWVILAHNSFPGIVGEEQEWYPLQRSNSVPCRLLEIQTPPPHGHPALVSALKPILVVTMPGVAETFNTVIDEMTHGTDFKLVNLLHAKNASLTHEDLNTSIDEPENWWNMHLVSYDTLSSRAKPSSNGQLSYCAWSFGIFDESHQYKTKNSVGWQIAMNAKIGFILQVTATPGFHSLYYWCYQTMWLCSGVSEDPEDETVMDQHGADALYSAVKCLMHAVWTGDEKPQPDVAHRMILIAKPWTITRWSESKLANGKPLVQIRKENTHLVDLEWTEDE